MKDLNKQRCSTLFNRINARKNHRRSSSFEELLLPKQSSLFREIDSLRTVRLHSYTSWPHSTPSGRSMSTSGWFYCNIDDRVVCIYCNTICHQWMDNDDPYDVHARLAPQCPFIRSNPVSKKPSSVLITESLPGTFQVRHSHMSQISRRQATFKNENWKEPSPTGEDLAHAGFFYSGHQTTVICFYCGRALERWGANDNPLIEHCRWFDHCLYAKHLAGDRVHRTIQILKHELSRKKHSLDEQTINRLVVARLDLPFVQLLRKQYSLPIIRRCLEQQLRRNHDDFPSDMDLTMACFILQKQRNILQDDPKKIIIPSRSQRSEDEANVKTEECSVCLTEERQLACVPCGHFSTCVVCGYALQSCPICREKIQSFIRIYC